MPKDDLLQSNSFVRIQSLNSAGKRRKSITYSEDQFDELANAGRLYSNQADDSGDADFSISKLAKQGLIDEEDESREENDEESLSEVNSSAGNTGTVILDSTKNSPSPPLEIGVRSSTPGSKVIITDDDASSNYFEVDGDHKPDSNRIHSVVKRLTRKEKLRYNTKYNKYMSHFSDVTFEYRPSILDGNISLPFQEKFKGPTLEAQVREYELKRRSKLHEKNFSYDDNADEVVVLNSDFTGLYVLFWMYMAFSSMKLFVEYYREHNGNLKESEIYNTMSTNLILVAVLDLVMYLETYFVFFIHWSCKKKILKWKNVGMIITSIYEFSFVIFNMYLTENILKLHWIAKIFLFLHSLVLLMKMHSYAFYNGYMWEILHELNFSTAVLNRLKDQSIPSSKEKTDEGVIKAFEKSQQFCSFELQAQSVSNTNIKFPLNINLHNFFMYSMFPTVVYQIEYPRTSKIRVGYVIEKIFAIFGTIFVMIEVAQIFMYPIVIRALALRDTEWTGLYNRLTECSSLFVDIIPSFIVMYLLVFYLIWDAILNCIAELTRFGDRYFYGDWWNCVSWAEFSRIWNVPVHKFLLRHVYHSSISFLSLSKGQATFMTFFISAIVHELTMYVIFKKLRCYLFFFQMLQLPLVIICNTKYLKDKAVMGNVIFWIGICTGPSIMCTMYLTL
ncbi:hypothetical protein TBLA_0F04000 [Henningerozyma blattae CBS 6284]|uniref:O-acyltransferase n=1 Tax=Henningerozyma blattae (strain ATCC 34711 / CBS 6284 / DSM 70876 / NBRC 10599 / NRRL Y-10934 / UCD 77-7) TaxID=1071380 RepID=I2H6D1_HENB6|nr:hypothetical protein TBLA_0F04000 [Tetrapisispora blattae CBS 6284]CCH61933.1 hypothetical protein TBLA_0F04000 [Tetrapisispora blattae CBS 6284]